MRVLDLLCRESSIRGSRTSDRRTVRLRCIDVTYWCSTISHKPILRWSSAAINLPTCRCRRFCRRLNRPGLRSRGTATRACRRNCDKDGSQSEPTIDRHSHLGTVTCHRSTLPLLVGDCVGQGSTERKRDTALRSLCNTGQGACLGSLEDRRNRLRGWLQRALPWRNWLR